MHTINYEVVIQFDGGRPLRQRTVIQVDSILNLSLPVARAARKGKKQAVAPTTKAYTLPLQNVVFATAFVNGTPDDKVSLKLGKGGGETLERPAIWDKEQFKGNAKTVTITIVNKSLLDRTVSLVVGSKVPGAVLPKPPAPVPAAPVASSVPAVPSRAAGSPPAAAAGSVRTAKKASKKKAARVPKKTPRAKKKTTRNP
jgi:hypothetical protein